MTDDFMEEGEQHAETIRLALAGDAEAGRYALLLCRDQLVARTLRPMLADYLAARLHQVIEGDRPDKALLIAKPPGRPPDPFPEWKQQLGAVAALLKRRGYAPQQITNALSDLRYAIFDQWLDQSDGYEILETWEPMQSLGDERLRGFAGAYWEKLSEYPPLT